MLDQNFKISQIAAFSENFALGKDNKLLWHFPEDLKFFKSMTLNKVMIMGRKTFQSFPKPLPGRHHVVISRSSSPSTNMVHYVNSVVEAIEKSKQLILEHKLDSEIMICGGAEIYKETLHICDHLYLTRIKGSFEADAFFPNHFMNHFALSLKRKSDLHPDVLTYEVWSKALRLA